ncbi:MAG: YcaO-like family protein [Chloroflexi bacterium]|nr:YcaO-like family protein [Chloroflexota bacterium]
MPLLGAGQGCHARREIALLRALTEATQSRLTVIAGTRDDLFVDDDASLTERTALATHRTFLAQPPAERPFTVAPPSISRPSPLTSSSSVTGSRQRASVKPSAST